MFTTGSIELRERRVLIVEDEHLAAEEMAAAVRRLGARVVGPVPGIGDTLALIGRGEAIDAAILDLNLAGGLVFSVAEALARHDIPIVFVTGYDDWMLPQEYDEVPVFRRPTDPDSLVRTLFRR